MIALTAVIDRGKIIETISGVEAYTVNLKSGTVDLYTSPTEKTTVDTFKHKLTFKDGSTPIAVFWEGKGRLVA